MTKVIDMTQPQIRKTVKKLKEALGADSGERAAMAYAKVDEEDYKLLTERHPELIDLAKRAAGAIGAKASINIKEAIDDGDIPTSRWYKEHTDDKFQKKVKVDGVQVVVTEEEREEAMKEMLEGLNDGK